MTKKLVILGSTGSIGRQTLDVCDGLPVEVLALTAGSNVERMAEQCRKYRPQLAVMATEEAAEKLQEALADLPIKIMSGEKGLMAAVSLKEADTVVTAVVGMLGLKPTLAAIRGGKRIGLANKETLVCAGELVMAAATEYGAEIIPVDSEHSAIFQCLMGCKDKGEIKRLILTCSGGPFHGMKKEEAARVTRRDALWHPNWKMGEKITIDCATLMNKGLEIIEAMRLYGLPGGAGDGGRPPSEHHPFFGGVSGWGLVGPAGCAGYAYPHPAGADLPGAEKKPGSRAGSDPVRPIDL